VRQAFPRPRRHQRRLHLELPLVEHPPDRLRAIEFVPFRAAVQADVATIMTAHVLVPALDEDRRRRCRAAWSPRVVLVRRLGFIAVGVESRRPS